MMDDDPIKIKTRGVCFGYGNRMIFKGIDADFKSNAITAIIGPSGQGKSSLLMTINRLWETLPGALMTGQVMIRFNNGYEYIYQPGYCLSRLRRKVGMVFQAPNPLPMSIYKNVAFPLKLSGYRLKQKIPGLVEDALQKAFLWDEVKDRLKEDARKLSGGQQQRLCIARALILEPEILLLDEPTSSLDAEAGKIIEQLLVNLKQSCTILMVSHYFDQVSRIADQVFSLTATSLIKM